MKTEVSNIGVIFVYLQNSTKPHSQPKTCTLRVEISLSPTVQHRVIHSISLYRGGKRQFTRNEHITWRHLNMELASRQQWTWRHNSTKETTWHTTCSKQFYFVSYHNAILKVKRVHIKVNDDCILTTRNLTSCWISLSAFIQAVYISCCKRWHIRDAECFAYFLLTRL